eukprot:m.41724 g.41724  ORF g.41724 m.41724 type:complete len:1038 (+) comp33233_c0_seq1:261-3374(+)
MLSGRLILSVAVVVTSAVILPFTGAVGTYELQARCAARCLVYTPNTSALPYSAVSNFYACILPCPFVPEIDECQEECKETYRLDAEKLANCSSTCVFLDQIRSQGSVSVLKKQLPVKLGTRPSFDGKERSLYWKIDRAGLYRDSSFLHYGISFVLQFVSVTPAQSNNITLVSSLAWKAAERPILLTSFDVTVLVPVPDPSKLYIFRIAIYNQLGSRGFSNSWSVPLNLSQYYNGSGYDVIGTDTPPYCSGDPGKYPNKSENVEHGDLELEENHTVAVSVSWEPPALGVKPSCYEVLLRDDTCYQKDILNKFVSADQTEYHLTGLQLGCSYYITVISYPLENAATLKGDTVAIDVPGCLDNVCPEGGPRNVSISYKLDDSEEFYVANLTWLSPVSHVGVTRYVLEYGDSGQRHREHIATSAGIEHFIEVKNLDPGETYKFKIIAQRTKSEAAVELEVKIPAILPASPINVTFEVVEKGIRIGWSMPPGVSVTSYYLRWRLSTSSEFYDLTIPVETRYHVLQDLEPDSSYSVEVSAVGSKGAGPSAERTFITPADLPTNEAPSSQVSVYLIVAASVLVIIVIVTIFVCYYRKRVEKKINASGLYPMALIGEGRFPARKGYIPSCRADDWEVDPSRIRILELLGEGFFGIVVKAEVVSRSASLATPPVERPAVQEPRVHRPTISSTRGLLSSSGSNGMTFGLPRTLVAIKMVKDGMDEEEQRDLLAEIAMMKKIGAHRHIVSIMGSVTQSLPLMLIIEYVPHGDLLSYLRKSRPVSVTGSGTVMNEYTKEPKPGFHKEMKRLGDIQDEDGDGDDDVFTCTNKPSPGPLGVDTSTVSLSLLDLITFAKQIALGLEYLHSKGVVHRDLACRNILVGENKQLKVSDFGLARAVYKEQAYVTTKRGFLPFKWMSIEAIIDRIFTPESDEWSFGIVLWEIFTLGGHPYPSLPDDQLVHSLKAGYRMAKPDSRCPDEIYEMMKQCWQLKPDDRPSATHLVDRLTHSIQAFGKGRRCWSLSNRSNGQWLSLSDLDSEEPSSQSASVS